MNVAANITGTRHISLRAVVSCFLVHLQPMVEGFGPWHYGSVRRALTGGGGGRAGPAVFGGWGARFLVDIWGLAAKEWESLVPAYTSSSIFCEKLRSGDAGESDNVSGEMGSGSCVSGDCDMLSWLPWLFSRKSSLGAGSCSCCSTSQSACDEYCRQGLDGMSMSVCFVCVVLSVSLWDSSTT